jgi:hypothetical protein
MVLDKGSSMFMPDPELATQSLDVPPFGRLLRFVAYGLELHRKDDPYNEVVRELQIEGSHRNVYLVDYDGVIKWRVADYDQPYAPDVFIDLESSSVQGKAIGFTFRGNIFEINLEDGSLTKTGWTK